MVSAVATNRERTSAGAVTRPDETTTAALPATYGDAIEVPDRYPHDESRTVDMIHHPGATNEIGAPVLEKLASVSLLVLAPAVITPVLYTESPAGHTVVVVMSRVLLPAPTTTTTPAAVAALVAVSIDEMLVRLVPGAVPMDMLMTLAPLARA